MAAPNPLAQLTRGKLVSTCKNFVNTFNWMAKWIYHLKVEGSMFLKEREAGRPYIGLAGFATAESDSVPHKAGGTLIWSKIESGGSGSSSVEVITGIECVIESGSLKLNITRSKIKNVTLESAQSQSVRIAGVMQKPIVTNVHYNHDGDHIFKQDKVENALIVYDSIPAEDTQSVFETTLHS